jgi:hypothetical protein
MIDDDLGALQSLLARHGRFGHREHLELAWTYLGRYPARRAARAMAVAIQHLAATHGASAKYHDTITGSWVHLVAVHRQRCEGETFDDFLARNPELLDQRLLEAHYSPALLWSEEARSHWVPPDIRSLPALCP